MSFRRCSSGIALAAAALAACAQAQPRPTCSVRLLKPAPSLDAPSADGLVVTFDEEALSTRTASDRRCRAAAGYVTALYKLGRTEHVVVAQSSGGATSLKVYDAVRCAWSSDEIDASAGFRLRGGWLEVAPVCADRGDAAPLVSCTAARVLVAAPGCAGLREDAVASRALTRALLGTAFAGKAAVSAARVARLPVWSR